MYIKFQGNCLKLGFAAISIQPDSSTDSSIIVPTDALDMYLTLKWPFTAISSTVKSEGAPWKRKYLKVHITRYKAGRR